MLPYFTSFKEITLSFVQRPNQGGKFLKFLTERSTSIHKLYHLHIEKFGKVFGHEERMMLQQIEAAEEKPNDGWKKPQ